jgi:DNA polymerase elongation subunit (family B)
LISAVNDVDKYIGKKYLSIPEEDGEFDFEEILITKEEVIRLKSLKYDEREYTIKILLNLQYGILYQDYYALVADEIAGDDCTALGRQSVKYARNRFRKEGYPIIYTDTDSWYFIDVFNDKDKYLKLKSKVIEEIKASMPFPQITFDADIDAEIKYMFFFKGSHSEDKESDSEMDEDDIINKPKGLMKKNYIYVTTDNELIIKNLGIKKKNISALSKKIFWEHFVKVIKEEGTVKFYKTEIQNLMVDLLQKDISLAYMRKSVGDLSQYKKSMTGIQAQISKKYGPGIHFLIPNKRHIGVGKEVKYCSISEFKKYNMDISDIDFTTFWKELNYFVKPQKILNLFDFKN